MSLSMVTQYSVMVANDPGRLARLTHLLARERVPVQGIWTVGLGDMAQVQFLPGREANMRRKLEAAGFAVLEKAVFHLDLPNQPGELNQLAQALARERINVLSLSTSTNGKRAKLAFCVDRPEQAAAVLARFSLRAGG